MGAGTSGSKIRVLGGSVVSTVVTAGLVEVVESGIVDVDGIVVAGMDVVVVVVVVVV